MFKSSLNAVAARYAKFFANRGEGPMLLAMGVIDPAWIAQVSVVGYPLQTTSSKRRAIDKDLSKESGE